MKLDLSVSHFDVIILNLSGTKKLVENCLTQPYALINYHKLKADKPLAHLIWLKGMLQPHLTVTFSTKPMCKVQFCHVLSDRLCACSIYLIRLDYAVTIVVMPKPGMKEKAKSCPIELSRVVQSCPELPRATQSYSELREKQGQ